MRAHEGDDHQGPPAHAGHLGGPRGGRAGRARRGIGLGKAGERQGAGLIVRRGTPEDVDAVVAFVERVDRARFDRSEEQWTAVRERLDALLRSPGTVTFVAEEDGLLVGELLAVLRDGGVAGIGVSVAEGSRRRGVATALFAEALAWAREAGLRELRLEVQEANEPARELYGKLGFVGTGDSRPGDRGPVLTMVRRLESGAARRATTSPGSI